MISATTSCIDDVVNDTRPIPPGFLFFFDRMTSKKGPQKVEIEEDDVCEEFGR
jgi:hypothetical protein